MAQGGSLRTLALTQRGGEPHPRSGRRDPTGSMHCMWTPGSQPRSTPTFQPPARCRGSAADAQCGQRDMLLAGQVTRAREWEHHPRTGWQPRLHQHVGVQAKGHAGSFEAFLGQVSLLHY